MQMLGVNSVV